ncbi:MAG: RNA polymerase sigma factor [Alphaproteobacteria bacterium]
MQDLRSSFEDHLAGLRRYARSLVGDPVESDDLVQECMLRALSASHLWPQIRNVRAYLFTVLHHAHVDYRADQRKRLPAAPLEQIEHLLHAYGNQDARLELRDMSRALAALSAEQREIVLLVAIDGLSYDEVSRRLSIPIGTVMSRLFRAREMLRYLMAGHGRKERQTAKKPCAHEVPRARELAAA